MPTPAATARWVTLPAATLTPSAGPGRAATPRRRRSPASASDVGQRRVGERVGRGDRDRARHVRDAVVDDPVDLVGRIGVGRRARGLEAAALVDRTRRRARRCGFISASCSRRTTYGARAPWSRTAPITRSARGSISSIAECEEYTVEARPPKATSSSRRRSMERVVDEHVRLHPDRDEGGVHPDRAAADHHHGSPPPRRGRRRAACPRPPSGFSSKKAPAWVAILPATSLIGASSGSAALRVLDGLVGDAGGARLAQALGELRARAPGAGR